MGSRHKLAGRLQGRETGEDLEDQAAEKGLGHFPSAVQELCALRGQVAFQKGSFALFIVQQGISTHISCLL